MIPELLDVARTFGVSYEVARYAFDTVLNEPAFQKATGSYLASITEEGIQLFRASGAVLIPKARRSLKRLIRHHVISKLSNLTNQNNYDYWKATERQIIIGRIERIGYGGEWIVAVAKETYGKHETLYAQCPKEKQPPLERTSDIIGKYRKFYCLKVTQENSNGTMAVKMVLSRTTKRLPELLLKHELSKTYIHNTEIKCTRRTAGKVTQIEASRAIDKAYLKSVMDDINEGIKVIRK